MWEARYIEEKYDDMANCMTNNLFMYKGGQPAMNEQTVSKNKIFVKNVYRVVLLMTFLLVMLFMPAGGSCAGAEGAKGTLLFVPHDNRPISSSETAEVAQAVGWNVIVPPEELLSRGTEKPGDPEALWKWVGENIGKADGAMLSSDSMIYGGLIASRKHQLSEEVLMARAEKFKELRKNNPKLKLYVFGSLMRTPKDGGYSGNEEPKYYLVYGGHIFRRTALEDKQTTVKLSAEEQKKLQFHKNAIPQEVWKDWSDRRGKNLKVTKRLMDMVRDNVISYMVVGKDDNAPLSATHMEGCELEKYGRDIPKTKFQILSGIDEYGLLLLTRGINDIKGKIPFVYVAYAPGVGAKMIPDYADAPIGEVVSSHITIAGGMQVNRPDKADVILVVHTNGKGIMGDGNAKFYQWKGLKNDGLDRDTTWDSLSNVMTWVNAGKNVALADIAFTNGADNALMNRLKDYGLLFHLGAYGGWNTATNTTGFVIGTGMLAPDMTPDNVDKLLLRRYLEDWGYQANVRPMLSKSVIGFREGGIYQHLGKREQGVASRATKLMRDFAMDNLPPFDNLDTVQVSFPWHRMFEADMSYGK